MAMMWESVCLDLDGIPISGVLGSCLRHPITLMRQIARRRSGLGDIRVRGLRMLQAVGEKCAAISRHLDLYTAAALWIGTASFLTNRTRPCYSVREIR